MKITIVMVDFSRPTCNSTRSMARAVAGPATAALAGVVVPEVKSLNIAQDGF